VGLKGAASYTTVADVSTYWSAARSFENRSAIFVMTRIFDSRTTPEFSWLGLSCCSQPTLLI
jgi:hypothetical protein